MAELEILPWAVIRGQEAMQGSITVPIEDLLPVLEDALESYHKVLLWDMDGIERNQPRLDLIRKFEGLGLWVDAGVRYAETVIDVLVAGADKAVVGTKSVWGLEEVRESYRMTENLVLQIDYNGGVIHPGRARAKPTPGELSKWVSSLGGDAVLLLSTEKPPDSPAVRAAAEHVQVYAGIAARASLESLEEAGAKGAIVDIWEVAGRRP